MDTTTVVCGLFAAWAALPALDAFLRLRRLGRAASAARHAAPSTKPSRLLVLVPSRAEGARVGDLAGDLKREGERREGREKRKEKISLKVEEWGADGGARPAADAPPPGVDVLVLLDGADPDAEARLARDGIHYLSKKSPGPSKGHALAFVGEQLAKDLDSYDFILVFDADMRVPEGFFRDLAVPSGTEAFQLPVRPAGIPGPGAPRLEALSLAGAARDDLARSAAGLPVRLRGKSMGFTPRAFRLGPAASARTTVEDSEATLRLLAAGIQIRTLDGPVAFDEPSATVGAMSRSRARWFAGHLKLFFTGCGDLFRLGVKSPKGAFVLGCDFWLRPKILVLAALAILAVGSDLAMVFFSSNAPQGSLLLLTFLLLLSFEAKLALVFEGLSLAALRRLIGYPPEVPPVSLADIRASLSMWLGAVSRGVLAPTKWHRARPPA